MSKFFKSIEEFVVTNGGDHAIKKILIANNGIGAIKAIRSIRKWSFETFGNEKMIQFVVMATPEDFNANAEFIRASDEVVDVPGGSNNNNYANINLICEIAVRHQVDAVMPMWGHASENPLLPTSLSQLPHRVTFIGPAAEPMQALGDKIGSTIIAQSAGVPTIAWNGDGLVVDYKATGIPDSVYNRANVTTAEEALQCCERIGYPVMIKASEGGGGKGIRKVNKKEEVLTSYRQVQSEIPGSPIFVMKMASKARHLEVQLIADKYGEAIALSGRDCSIQRRHQKIIEEGPPIAAPVHIFKQMEQAAVSLAKTVGYCSAGTVEYLYMEDTQEFAFLELNPRLQVEHPVTENILGINLPSCQLQVAMGLPLHRIADIRRLYGRHVSGKDTIDFTYSERVVTPRHCIAVRVTAENPEEGFQPTSGRIQELQFRSSIDVWGYFSVDNTSRVHEFADSQFGHIFASGPDRESARRAMVVALKELSIRGDIRTTVEYIIKMIQSSDYVDNLIDTAWLDKRIENHKELLVLDRLKYCPPAPLVALCGSTLQSFRCFQSKGQEFIDMLQVGQIPNKDSLSPTVSIDLILDNVKYKTNCILSGSNNIIVECNGMKQCVEIRPLADNGYIFNISGKSHVAYFSVESGGTLRMILDGHTCMFTPEYDPTRLTSSVAGKLARLLVANGTHVKAGEPYVEIEVMKMYMPLKAPEAGIVTFQMSEGAVLSPGDLIAVMALDEPDKVVKSELFSGLLVVPEPPSGSLNTPSHVIMRTALKELEKVLDGYVLTEAEIHNAVDTFLLGFHDRLVPLHELEEAMSVLRGRIDTRLFTHIQEIARSYKSMIEAIQATSPSMNTIWPDFPAAKILTKLHEYAMSQPFDKRGAFLNQTSTLWLIMEPYLYSEDVRKLVAIQKLMERYLSVERQFDNMSFTDVVSQLRKFHSNHLLTVMNLCRSHINIQAKNILMIRLMEEMRTFSISIAATTTETTVNIPLRGDMNTRGVKIVLRDLAKLRQQIYIHVSFTANLVLINQNNLRPETRRQRLNEAITAALTTGDPVGKGDRKNVLKRFVDSNVVIRDLLLESMRQDKDYRIAVMELYLLKIYQATHSLDEMVSGHSLSDSAMDNVSWIRFDFHTNYMSAVKTIGAAGATTVHVNSRLSGAPSAATATAGVATVDVEVSSPTSNSAVKMGHRPTFLSLTEKSALNNNLVHPVVLGKRQGVIVCINSTHDLITAFPLIVKKINSNGQNHGSAAEKEKVNVMHIILLQALLPTGQECADDEMSAFLNQFLSAPAQVELMSNHGIRRVSFLMCPSQTAAVSSPTATAAMYSGSSTGIRNSGLLTAKPFEKKLTRSNSFRNSFSSSTQNLFISIFTYRFREHFAEDCLCRHIEAPHASHLDLSRLSNFKISLENIPSVSGNVFLYRAVPFSAESSSVRFFARLVSFSNDASSNDAESLFVEALDILGIAISREEAHAASASRHSAQGSATTRTAANHMFLNIVSPDTVLQLDYQYNEIRRICTKYWEKMARLSITCMEVKLNGRLSLDSKPLTFRLVASNPTGFVLTIDKYFEEAVDGDSIGATGVSSKGAAKRVFRTLNSSNTQDMTHLGPWDGIDTQTPHEISHQFEKQRAEAMASSETLYVYDWPVLFKSGVEKLWADHHSKLSSPPAATAVYERRKSGNEDDHLGVPYAAKTAATAMLPAEYFQCHELVLCDAVTKKPLSKGWTAAQAKDRSVMLPSQRDPGLNDAGMVAWLIRMLTPECPQGRELVVICNDITFQAGSFGTKEDIIFFKASEFARQRGIPRFFLSANSGARIGMAQSLRNLFQVQWTDESDPSKGFKHLYLKKDDYNTLMVKFNNKVSDLPVRCAEPVTMPSGDVRYIITDIIGEEADLGVENLMGSGLIAGETARAYDEIFTLTLVVGRTVGIGAYLVRLGQRTVQKTRNSPIILTGYQALNKLMGREIYTTNDQLGGPMIMFPNGVSHLLAETHLDSVNKALTWLSYIPAVRGAPLPVMEVSALDSVERSVEVFPSKTSYDPRILLCGVAGAKRVTGSGGSGTVMDSMSNDQSIMSSDWQSGFFDHGSFIEALSGWAKTVVVGRGRLGGIPMGVIVTENRTAEMTKPADPADATSREKMVQQAGGVWFPDSAYKTAQALRDFNREGLPCIIFANWRGFSGGQRDMFDEVLKFGSMIVDALVAYQQPLFVYIPPFAELRGGAWVVVDSTINAEVMEFYAAEEARGGVLEAAGAASIKFRDRDVIQTSHRIDPVLMSLDAQLKTIKSSAATATAAVNEEEIKNLEKKIKQRERMLFGVYQQVAVHFADLHDTPGRMEAKGVIRRQVLWKQSRAFFYWRLRRRLWEFELYAKYAKYEDSATVTATATTAASATGTKISKKEFSAKLKDMFVSVYSSTATAAAASGAEKVWEDDKSLVQWVTGAEGKNMQRLEASMKVKHQEFIAARLSTLLQEAASPPPAALPAAAAPAGAGAGAGAEGMTEESITNVLKLTLDKLSPEMRSKVLASFKKM